MLPCKCYQFCNHVSSPTWSSSSIRRFQRRSKTPLFPGSVYFKKSNKTLKVQWVSPNHESRNAHVLNPKLQSFPLYWISDTECAWYLEKIPWCEAATQGAISSQWKPQGRLPSNKSADLSFTKRCKDVLKLYTVINCAKPIYHSRLLVH